MALISVLPTLLTSAWADAALAAEAAPRPRVAVLNAVNLPANLAEQRAKLGEALAAAVRQRGYDLVATSSACADAECLRSLASGSGVTDILVVAGGPNELMGYRIELRLWNAAADREDHSLAECNTCSAAQMIESVVRAAGPLLNRIPALHAVQPTSIGIGAPTPVPSVAAPAPTTPAPNTPSRSPARWALGLSLIGVGAIAGTTGIVLWSRNGDPANCNGGVGQVCPTVYDTRTQGIALTVGGIVAAGAGAAVLLILPERRSASIAFTPGGLSIAGTY